MRHIFKPFIPRINFISLNNLNPIKNISLIIVAVLVIPLTHTFAGGKQSTASLDFQLQTFAGQTVCSEELANKVVLLEFWDFNSLPSMQLMPQMAILEEYFNMNLDVVIIAVNVGRDSFDVVKSFVKNTTHNLQFVYDKESTITNALGIEELPSIIIIDKDSQYHTNHTTFKAGQEKEMVEYYKRLVEKLL